MYSFFCQYNYNFYQTVTYDVPRKNIYSAIKQNSRLNINTSLSIAILAIAILLPIPVRANLNSKEFPILTSKASPPQIFAQSANTPIPPDKDSTEPPIPNPTPTTSPFIPGVPENIPEIPEESPEFTPPEDVKPSQPKSDIIDDIPHPVPSNNLPSSSPEKSSSGNLLETASVTNSLNTFARAIEAVGLTDILIEDFFTIFAPTNQAFSASLAPGAMEFLFKAENKDLLEKILRYHIIKGEVAAKDLTTGKLDTLGGSIAIRVTPQRIILNDSSIIRSDIQATNGVIHSINRVLIPRHLRNAIKTKMSRYSDINQR